ncbi:MAG: ABC transporter ATP-binding protein [Desulfovibrionales bacterium]|mgnify:CR=1 FL=1|nr:ABC transporter ATP-binding protein [Desulfovibrionales bacterium]
MKPVISFRNVTKSYPLYGSFTSGIKNFLFHLPTAIKEARCGQFQALSDISFDIHSGETVGFIGSNGAGKSSILSLIAGVIQPTTGEIEVNGRVSPLLELGAGFHFELTGRDNILLNGVLLGLTKAQVLAKMDQIIDYSEIGQFIDQPIRSYSSGMLARLGFSVVAHLEPEILLLDEMLAVGDASFQKKCLRKMMEFREDNVTMVFVSHSMDDVLRICTRVLWIKDHAIFLDGSPGEVVSAYLSQNS